MSARALAAAAALLLPSAASALAPPHDASRGIDCPSCHAVHGNLLPQGALQEALCRSCHNPTGQAAAKSDVASHVVGGGARTLYCGDCHDVHAPWSALDPHSATTARNLSLVRTDATKAVPAAATPLVFQRRPGHLAFAEADAPWDGACQACHAATAHHTRDGAADHAHGMGQDCTACHRHARGFLVGCVDCHAQPQDDGNGIPAGGRRAVTPEFPASPAHGHLGGAAVRDGDCRVCHGLSRHQTGTVELVDPDGGATTWFVLASDLGHDPDVGTFCLACHDADGARRLAAPLDPFGSGVRPFDVASRLSGTLRWLQAYLPDPCWGGSGTLRPVSSHHDLTDADQAFSGAKLECLSCHGAHAASSAFPVVDPASPLAPWTGTVNGFCLRCHSGGSGPAAPGFPPGVGGPSVALVPLDSCAAPYRTDPYWVDYTYPHGAHGAGSKRPWAGYSGAPAYDLQCTVCHDAHGSATPTNPAGNPYLIRDVVDGTPFVDDGGRGIPWLGPPWTVLGVRRAVEIPVAIDGSGYGRVDFGGPPGLCSACHSAWQQVESFIHSGDAGGGALCHNCNMCHGHGQAWGEHDWVNGTDPLVCP